MDSRANIGRAVLPDVIGGFLSLCRSPWLMT
jgi:hypothetical protein